MTLLLFALATVQVPVQHPLVLGASDSLSILESYSYKRTGRVAPEESAERKKDLALYQEFKYFKGAVAQLPAQEAARRWLHIAEGLRDRNPAQVMPAFGFADLMGALPLPASWPIIARDAGSLGDKYALLGKALIGNVPGFRKQLDSMIAKAKSTTAQSAKEPNLYSLLEAKQSLALATGDASNAIAVATEIRKLSASSKSLPDLSPAGDAPYTETQIESAFAKFKEGQVKEITDLFGGPSRSIETRRGFFDGMIDWSERGGDREKWFDFVQYVAKRGRQSVSWKCWIALAFANVDRQEALQRLHDMAPLRAENPDAEQSYIDLLLHLGRTEEAVKELRKDPYLRVLPSEDLLHLGSLLHREDWIQEGMRKRDLGVNWTLGLCYTNGNEKPLDEIYVRNGKAASVEGALAGTLPMPAIGSMDPEHQGALQGLIHLYRQLNRPADIVRIVREARCWNTDDLSVCYLDSWNGGLELGLVPHTLGEEIAWAFAKTGDSETAMRLVRPSLWLNPRSDGAYETLLDLRGRLALPLLDQLSQNDPLQARPILWRAEELRRIGRLRDAEEAARAFLALCPFDAGQDGAGRSRPYSLLAQILSASGKSAQARDLARTARAIALGWEGDQFMASGLAQEAIRKYRQGLAVRPGIYDLEYELCQSLESVGEREEADLHLRRAFDCLPLWVGRAGTFEGSSQSLFDSPRRARIANDALSGFVRKHPNNSRGHFLLGRAKMALGASASEIARQLKCAVKLDPLYFEAWMSLLKLENGVTKVDRIKALKAVSHLDPFKRHGSYQNLATCGLSTAEVWSAIPHSTRAFPYQLPDNLFPLKTEKSMAAAISVYGRPTMPVSSPGAWLDCTGMTGLAARLISGSEIDFLTYDPNDTT